MSGGIETGICHRENCRKTPRKKTTKASTSSTHIVLHAFSSHSRGSVKPIEVRRASDSWNLHNIPFSCDQTQEKRMPCSVEGKRTEICILYIYIYIHIEEQHQTLYHTVSSNRSKRSNTNGAWRCLSHLSRTHNHKCRWAFRQHGSGPSRVPYMAVVSGIPILTVRQQSLVSSLWQEEIFMTLVKTLIDPLVKMLECYPFSRANGHNDPETSTNAGGANRDCAFATCLAQRCARRSWNVCNSSSLWSTFALFCHFATMFHHFSHKIP